MQDSSTISAVVTDDSSTMTSAEEDTDNIGILGSDPGLEQYKDHFKYRVRKYAEQKALFEKYEGGLEEFAQGDQFLLDMKIAIFFLSFLLPHRKLLISKHFVFRKTASGFPHGM